MASEKAAPLSQHNAFDHAHRKEVGTLPLFDPTDGIVVAEPPGEGDGYWAGGPSAIFDRKMGAILLKLPFA